MSFLLLVTSLFLHLQLFLDDTKVKNFVTCFKGNFTFSVVNTTYLNPEP